MGKIYKTSYTKCVYMLRVIFVLKGEIRLHVQLSGRCLKVLKAWYCRHHASTWIWHYATYLFVLLVFRFVLLFSFLFFWFGAFSMYVWPVSSDQCKFSTLLNFKLDDLANCSWSWIFFFVRNGSVLQPYPIVPTYGEYGILLSHAVHNPYRQNFLQLLQCCCRALGSLPDQFSSCLFITVVPYFLLFWWLASLCSMLYPMLWTFIFFYLIFINLSLDGCLSVITSLWCLAFALFCNGVNVGKILLGQLNFIWG